MFGFALGYRGPVTAARPRNLLSVHSRCSAVTIAVALEVSWGHTMGPFIHPPFRLFHCSPLGATVKPDGSMRLILDLSSPHGASVNSGISREEFAVRYTSADAAMDIVRRLGNDAFMAKGDIRHAFRLCPVQPADWPLLCYQWAGRVYVDLRLPFGAGLPPSSLPSLPRRFTGLLSTFAGASTSSTTSMTIFWCGPLRRRAPMTWMHSRTSAATSVSPSCRRSWSCRRGASSSWASP